VADKLEIKSKSFCTSQEIDWQFAATLLKPLRKGHQIGYGWSIAQKIASTQNRSVIETAADLTLDLTHQLAQSRSPMSLALPVKVLPALQVSVTETGLIQLTLTDWAIAQWLSWVLETTFSPRRLAVDPSNWMMSPEFRFLLQHSHARCCSLLRLAHQSEVITLGDLARQPWQWQQPIPIPWLETQTQQPLRLNHPSERQLVKAIFIAVDALQQPSLRSPKQWQELAIKTVSAFQAFHRDRPLWTARGDCATLQAQLGLIMATQRSLLYLLNELQMEAPGEL
jgi:hypothetical protein